MTAWGNLSQGFSFPFGLMLAAALAGLAILLVCWRRARAARRRQRQARVLQSEPFQRSFDLLLDARWREAAEVLKDAIKNDPNRRLEYLELGKLFRRHGEPGRAARMFEQLLARAGLDSAVNIAAQYELALAYQVLGWHEVALARLEQVLGADPSHAEARYQLRCLYEDLGRWDSAAAVEMLRLKRGEARDRRTLAALLTQQGKVAWAAGNLRASVAYLKSALRLDPEGSEAALCLGRILLRQGKLPQAFRVWDGLAKQRPEWLFLAFDDLQAAFRQINNEGGWEDFLRAFTQRHSDDPAAYLALADWYGAHDQTAEALQCLRLVLELDPLCQAAQLAVLSLHRSQGMPGEVLDDYERLIRATTQRPAERFRCLICGQARHEPFWKCPACRTWTTPQRLLPQPSSMPIMTGDMTPRLNDALRMAVAPIVATRDTPRPPAPSA
jgi:lipopolysaccharide biosynthesis regulator YciM